MKKNCFIYLRVSTEDQVKGFSLDNQRKACKDYAEMNGYQVKEVFVDDGKSGRNLNRPAFQDMFKKLKDNSVSAIVIYKIDRLARNIADFANIRKELKKYGD